MKLKLSMEKFSEEKYKIGVNQELLFLSLMKLHHIVLDNMNDTDKSSSVDFQVPGTNCFIELKYRQIPSDRYKDTPFDKKKVDRWNRDQHLSKSIVFICFAYADNTHHFIKYDKPLFDTFKRFYRADWDTTNYMIPLSKCFGLDEFVRILSESTTDYSHQD